MEDETENEQNTNAELASILMGQTNKTLLHFECLGSGSTKNKENSDSDPRPEPVSCLENEIETVEKNIPVVRFDGGTQSLFGNMTNPFQQANITKKASGGVLQDTISSSNSNGDVTRNQELPPNFSPQQLELFDIVNPIISYLTEENPMITQEIIIFLDFCPAKAELTLVDGFACDNMLLTRDNEFLICTGTLRNKNNHTLSTHVQMWNLLLGTRVWSTFLCDMGHRFTMSLSANEEYVLIHWKKMRRQEINILHVVTGQKFYDCHFGSLMMGKPYEIAFAKFIPGSNDTLLRLHLLDERTYPSDSDNVIQIHRMHSEEELRDHFTPSTAGPLNPLEEFQDSISSTLINQIWNNYPSIDMSSDGVFAVTAGTSPTSSDHATDVKIWNLDGDYECILHAADIPNPFKSELLTSTLAYCEFMPNDSSILLYYYHNVSRYSLAGITIIASDTLERLVEIRAPKDPKCHVVAPNSELIAVGSADTITIYSCADGSITNKITAGLELCTKVKYLTISNDSERIIAHLYSRNTVELPSILVLDIRSDTQLAEIRVRDPAVGSIIMSRDGNFFITSSMDTSIKGSMAFQNTHLQCWNLLDGSPYGHNTTSELNEEDGLPQVSISAKFAAKSNPKSLFRASLAFEGHLRKR